MTLPQDRDAELEVLHAVLVEPRRLDSIRHLTPDHFLNQRGRALLIELREITQAGREWDATDPEYAWLAIAAEPAFTLWEEKIRRIEEAYVCRSAYLLATELGKAAAAGDTPTVRRLVSEARLPNLRPEFKLSAHAASEVWDRIEAGDTDVVQTGFRALDSVEALRRGELFLLGGRPSMGKSQWAFQVADHVDRNGGVVVVASLEMSGAQAVARMAQARAGRSVRDKAQDAKAAVSNALASMMGRSSIYVLDRPMTSLDLWSQCRTIADDRGKIDLIVSDHVRLFSDRHEAERHRLGQIASNHRQMAREFHCPVILCVQLSRATEAREDKRPGLPDMRDSGELEEAADVAAFIYRGAYYKRGPDGSQTGEAQIYAAKNRSGALWGARLAFLAEAGARFADLERE